MCDSLLVELVASEGKLFGITVPLQRPQHLLHPHPPIRAPPPPPPQPQPILTEAGIGDFRGALLGRCDYGPFNNDNPHKPKPKRVVWLFGNDEPPILVPQPVCHPQQDADERLAVAAMLCSMAATKPGRKLLSTTAVLETIVGLQRLSLTYLLSSPPASESLEFALAPQSSLTNANAPAPSAAPPASAGKEPSRQTTALAKPSSASGGATAPAGAGSATLPSTRRTSKLTVAVTNSNGSLSSLVTGAAASTPTGKSLGSPQRRVSRLTGLALPSPTSPAAGSISGERVGSGAQTRSTAPVVPPTPTNGGKSALVRKGSALSRDAASPTLRPIRSGSFMRTEPQLSLLDADGDQSITNSRASGDTGRPGTGDAAKEKDVMSDYVANMSLPRPFVMGATVCMDCGIIGMGNKVREAPGPSKAARAGGRAGHRKHAAHVDPNEKSRQLHRATVASALLAFGT